MGAGSPSVTQCGLRTDGSLTRQNFHTGQWLMYLARTMNLCGFQGVGRVIVRYRVWLGTKLINTIVYIVSVR